MAQIRARGVIIKQSDYGEGHRMLSIFSREYGIIKAVSYGVKRAKSKAAASTQFLCYGDFELYKNTNKDIMTVNNIETIDGFYPISEDIRKLSLCVYFADITYSILGMNNPDKRILGIFLNSLYALAYRDEKLPKVKAVYEMKLMCAGGYMPMVNRCVSCGGYDIYAFDVLKGGAVCRSCGGKNLIPMNKPLYNAVMYIISCADKKMLSFDVNDRVMEMLSRLTEQYILLQTDQKFQSLEYYKAITDM